MFKALSTVFKKEIKELLRDKRSLFISLIFPLILFPLIFGLMDNSRFFPDKTDSSVITAGAVITGEESSIDSSTSSVFRKALIYLESKARLNVQPLNNVENYIDSASDGSFHAVLVFSDNSITVVTDNSRQASINAGIDIYRALVLFAENASKTDADTDSGKESNTGITVSVNSSFVYSNKTGGGKLVLSTLLPMVLLVFAALSPAAAAADLGAGEKERQTLEPLLSSPVPRLSIIAGKLGAAAVMGTAGIAAYLTGLGASTILNPYLFSPERIVFFLTFHSLLLIIFFTLILSVFFSSIELSLSIFARSAKEAQILFLPVLLLSTAAGYSVTLADPFMIETLYRHIPLVNTGVLLKELSLGIVNLPYIFITLLWNIVYIFFSFLISLRLINNEKVIYRN